MSNKRDNMETTKELFKISVAVTGVKKRCRKSEFHVLRGGYIPYNGGSFDREAVEGMARGLVDSNMKQVNSRIIVHLDRIEKGDFMETWEMFSDKNIKFELKTPLENELN